MHLLLAAARLRRSSRFWLAAVTSIVLLWAPAALAQGLLAVKPPAKPAPSASAAPSTDAHAPHDKADEEEATEEPDSPRASMANFLELTRAGDYAGAAQYLELPKQR